MALLLHLTDFHLYADPGAELKGVRTLASFRAVKSAAWQRFPRPDAVLLGGDLAQDELATTYRLLADEILGWTKRFLVTPGNHCDLGALRRTLLPALGIPGLDAEPPLIDNWRVLTLNSNDPEASPGGRLGADELERLKRELARNEDAHVLIALHHHPLPIGSPWMDAMMLEDCDAFWQTVRTCDRVRAIVFGHVHQVFDTEHQGIRLLGSPSTCIQFRPNTERFELDDASPGYRWLRLFPDGRLETGIERVEGFVPPDLSDTSTY